MSKKICVTKYSVSYTHLVEEVGSVEKKFMEASMGKAVLKKGEETYYAEIDGKISYDL